MAQARMGILSWERVPPPAFFFVSAVFHYLGPSFAVLLFARLNVLEVAWLRVTSAAVIFAASRRPGRRLFALGHTEGRINLYLGAVLAAMNTSFYIAISKLPLATVNSIEFLGTVLLAAVGFRTRRNVLALAVTVLGVFTITEIRIAGEATAFAFAFLNCALFMLYVILGHRIAGKPSKIDRLAASMVFAAIFISPVSMTAWRVLSNPALLLAGVGVGVCSSVIPYITDQLAMARLPRASFALMLALLPLFATLIGACVLHQIPSPKDAAGIGLVVAGVALHRQE